jgi:hypothetical protein
MNAKIVIDKVVQTLSGSALQKNIKLVSELEEGLFYSRG